MLVHGGVERRSVVRVVRYERGYGRHGSDKSHRVSLRSLRSRGRLRGSRGAGASAACNGAEVRHRGATAAGRHQSAGVGADLPRGPVDGREGRTPDEPRAARSVSVWGAVERQTVPRSKSSRSTSGRGRDVEVADARAFDFAASKATCSLEWRRGARTPAARVLSGQDVHGPGDDESQDHERKDGLEGHHALGPGGERHDVGGAQRS